MSFGGDTAEADCREPVFEYTTMSSKKIKLIYLSLEVGVLESASRKKCCGEENFKLESRKFRNNK